MMEYDTENMNSEEIYSSLRGVTEAIQSFSHRSQEDLNEPIRRDGKRDDAVSDGDRLLPYPDTDRRGAVTDVLSSVPQAVREGVSSSPGSDPRLGLDMVEGGRTALDNKTSLLNTPSPRSFSGPRGREFAPFSYAETICTYDKSALKEAVFDDDVEQFRDCESQQNLTGVKHGVVMVTVGLHDDDGVLIRPWSEQSHLHSIFCQPHTYHHVT